MTASSTSSSDGRRTRTRTRLALLACVATAALTLGATVPLNAALEAREFETSAFGRAAAAATAAAEGRPLVAILGTSQTQTGVDGLRIEERLRDEGAPFVAGVAAAGLHASVFPAMTRDLVAHARLDTLVLELGHIAHDQYGGSQTVRNFIGDESVLRAFDGSARGRALLATIRDERMFPWLATPRLLRVVYDGTRRDTLDAILPTMRRARGFQPYAAAKDFDEVVGILQDDPAYSAPDLEDASMQRTFVEVAKVCAAEARAAGAKFAVYMHPVNRPVVARVKVVRHFERTAREETIPALRAAGIEVLVPPDAFFEPGLFYDHVHLVKPGAEALSEWLAGEISRIRSAR